MPFLYLSHHVHAQDRLMIVSCLSLLFSCNYSTTTICWWRWATVSAVESCYFIITSVISFYRFGGLWWSEDEYDYVPSACKYWTISCRAPPPSLLVLFTGLEKNASQSERERRGIFHQRVRYYTMRRILLLGNNKAFHKSCTSCVRALRYLYSTFLAQSQL